MNSVFAGALVAISGQNNTNADCLGRTFGLPANAGRLAALV